MNGWLHLQGPDKLVCRWLGFRCALRTLSSYDVC
jgi:hypothetical protein